MIPSTTTHTRQLPERDVARAEDAQGTPPRDIYHQGYQYTKINAETKRPRSGGVPGLEVSVCSGGGSCGKSAELGLLAPCSTGGHLETCQSERDSEAERLPAKKRSSHADVTPRLLPGGESLAVPHSVSPTMLKLCRRNPSSLNQKRARSHQAGEIQWTETSLGSAQLAKNTREC